MAEICRSQSGAVVSALSLPSLRVESGRLEVEQWVAGAKPVQLCGFALATKEDCSKATPAIPNCSSVWEVKACAGVVTCKLLAEWV